MEATSSYWKPPTSCRPRRRYASARTNLGGLWCWSCGHRRDDLAPQNAPHGRAAHRFTVRKVSLTWVELSGLEPLTSCMPSGGSTSTHVHPCRSPSSRVPASPPASGWVAVLPCCTAPIRGRRAPPAAELEAWPAATLGNRLQAHAARRTALSGQAAPDARPSATPPPGSAQGAAATTATGSSPPQPPRASPDHTSNFRFCLLWRRSWGA